MTKLEKTYVGALHKVAEQKSLVDDFTKQIDMINSILNENSDLCKIVSSRTVSKKIKWEIIHLVFSKNVNPLLLSFLLLVVEKHRYEMIANLHNIWTEYSKLAGNTIKCKIIAYSFLENSELDIIKKSIESLYKKVNFEFELSVDSSLLGGFKYEINNIIYDYSLIGRFKKLKDSFS